MLSFIKSNILAVIIGVVLLVGVGYYLISSGGSAPALTSSADGTSVASQQLLTTLSSLRTIKLNSGIFSDPVFVSLTDFGVVIPKQSTGRRNPFAPLTAGVSVGNGTTLKLPAATGH